MTDQFFSTPAALARLHAGPLGPHMDLFASLLSKRGYAKITICRHLRVVAQLSHWLEEQALGVDELDEKQLSGFKEQASRKREVARRARAALPILLEHLREIGVVGRSEPLPPGSALDCTLHDFSQYLARQRSLAQTTITRYRRVIRDFLGERFGSGPIVLAELSATDVRQFVLRLPSPARLAGALLSGGRQGPDRQAVVCRRRRRPAGIEAL